MFKRYKIRKKITKSFTKEIEERYMEAQKNFYSKRYIICKEKISRHKEKIDEESKIKKNAGGRGNQYKSNTKRNRELTVKNKKTYSEKDLKS